MKSRTKVSAATKHRRRAEEEGRLPLVSSWSEKLKKGIRGQGAFQSKHLCQQEGWLHCHKEGTLHVGHKEPKHGGPFFRAPESVRKSPRKKAGRALPQPGSQSSLLSHTPKQSTETRAERQTCTHPPAPQADTRPMCRSSESMYSLQGRGPLHTRTHTLLWAMKQVDKFQRLQFI